MKNSESEEINMDNLHSTHKKEERSLSRQIVLGLLSNFSTISPAMSLGFSAVALPVLCNELNPYALNKNQASWFASAASLASPLGSFVSGPIADKYGRRSIFACINTVSFIGWLLIASAFYLTNAQYSVLLVGRILTGFSTGLSSAPATVYMVEVASIEMRSVFTTWTGISFATGIVLVYILGLIFQENWGAIAFIAASLTCFGMLCSRFFIPESPPWLINKNRIEDAKTNLCSIYDVKECNNEINKELEQLIKSKGKKTNVNVKSKTFYNQLVKKVRFLLQPNCLKPFILMILFFFFQQFSGIYVIVFYAINIVTEAGVKIDPYLAIVFIALTRFVAAILLSFISKRFGRRPLSLFSGSVMSFSMIVLAIYVFLTDSGHIPQSVLKNKFVTYLPITLLVFHFFASTIGFLTVPFAMAPELFPTKIRGTAAGLGSCSSYIFGFIIIKLYPTMVDIIKSQGVFLFYGIISLIGTIFVAFFLPETKDKSFEEIQEYFTKSNEKFNKRSNVSNI